MKAVIRLDVPDWQIGQPVTVYFKDTMQKKACGMYGAERTVKFPWTRSTEVNDGV